jgi:glycosyltransferase involved in cell wall biosynthesis
MAGDSDAPVAVFGLPVYNGQQLMARALGSLLAQTRTDLAVVVSDDASTDRTRDVVAEFAARDPRVTLSASDRRLGLIGNWRRAYEEARRLHPSAPFFAWASDHDYWEPGWLAALAHELESHPEAVIAYPRTRRVAPDGGMVQPPWRFATADVDRPLARLSATSRRMVAGDMIYGLFRAVRIADAGVFPRLVFPDRFLLARLSLFGTFRQVDDVLWERRLDALSTPSKQRRINFGEQPPLHAHLPWWLVHSVALARASGGGPRAGATYGAAALRFAAASTARRAVMAVGRRLLGRARIRRTLR